MKMKEVVVAYKRVVVVVLAFDYWTLLFVEGIEIDYKYKRVMEN